jgi:PAS domain S-box-containing protein
MHRPFDKWLVIGLGVVVALLLVDAVVGYENTRQLHTDAAAVAHTYEVLGALDELLSTMKDAETGQRGYLITKDEGYLKPYHNALAVVHVQLDQLKALTHDNEYIQEHIPRLSELIEDKLDELARTISLRDDQGFEPAKKEVLTHLGQNRMEGIRNYISEMKVHERGLLVERKEANNRAYVTTLVSGALTSLLALLGVGGFIVILNRHLTARLKAAAVLREQREWLRTTLTSIGDGVIATDTFGRVTFLNAVAQRLTGWTEQEAKGEPLAFVFRIVNEETRAPVDNPALRALREGTVVGLANHTLLIARTGVEQPIDDSAAPIRDEQGQITGVVLVFRDVTERRRAELALREADRRKNEFLATLAHELRNPLAPIANAVELLRRANDNPAVREQARSLMERQVGVLIRLVDDLLDVSRIAQGKIQLRRERIALASAVQSAVETARPHIEASQHQLTVKLPPDPVVVDGDPTRLAEVIANLLTNAAKYTEPGGRIALTVERQGTEAVVSVRDTGIGIAAEHLPHLFKMFSQVSPVLERSQGGLGIGLSLVRGLVELHGGTVEARSEGLGRGSEFIVRLPLAQDEGERTKDEGNGAVGPSSPVPRPARKVLVVDDNRDAADTLVMILRMMGHEIATAYDGEEAVQTAAEFRPDVIFLDIGLPRMNGYEVARHIRAQPWGREIALIALSGWGQEEDKRRALEAGIDQHLTKPVEATILANLLARLDPQPQGR